MGPKFICPIILSLEALVGSLWKKSFLAFVAWPPSILPLSQATDYELRRGHKESFQERGWNSDPEWQSKWFAWSRRKKENPKYSEYFWPPE